ncbi:DUF6985 domain-containing protein [Enorma massiliensis]|uniref:DUF6985 domain-containing protein n=1 Tax=Enorma massiliensis TaxID=1472761 RepID=UPI003AF02905
MPSLTINLWGRQFNLEIIYDLLDNEEISANQTKALEALTSSWGVVENALEDVKQHCLNDNQNGINDKQLANIFKYVVPQALYICRSEITRVVGLLCAYRFDPEHNLALIFENERLREIGPEDILL